jgi:transcriptional regulator with XRE-family HTH domain
MNIIEENMIKNGLNQEYIGSKIGLSQPSVSLLINGKLKSIKIDVARKLSDALGVRTKKIIRTYKKDTNDTDNDNVLKKDISNDISKEKTKKFIKPTVERVLPREKKQCKSRTVY